MNSDSLAHEGTAYPILKTIKTKEQVGGMPASMRM